MLPPPEFEDDFRAQAIRASNALVPLHARDRIADLDVSCCLASDQPAGRLRWGIWISLGGIVLGFLGLGAGAFLAVRSEAPDGSYDDTQLYLGLVCSLFGMAMLFLPAKGSGWIWRRILGRRYDDLRERPELQPLMQVEIEDAATFSKLKMVSDDIAFLAIDEGRRRLILEGVRCRYVIRAEDLLDLSPRRENTSTGCQIRFRIGSDCDLNLMIIRFYVRDEVVRQLTGRVRSRLFERIGAAMSLQSQ